jgi:hypothetical protein
MRGCRWTRREESEALVVERNELDAMAVLLEGLNMILV